MNSDAGPSDYNENFWLAVEKNTGNYIPIYMENIFNHTGYTNPTSLRRLTEEKLDKLENFVRTKPRPTCFNPEEYYGMYEDNPEKFEFRLGDRELILGLAYLAKKSEEKIFYGESVPTNVSFPDQLKIKTQVLSYNVDQGDYNQKFWLAVEKNTRNYIPIYMENIFNHTGYTNPTSLRRLTEEKLDKLENFVRTKPRPTCFYPEDYYGIYHDDPEKFEFRLGDRELILGLAYLAKESEDNISYNKSVPDCDYCGSLA